MAKSLFFGKTLWQVRGCGRALTVPHLGKAVFGDCGYECAVWTESHIDNRRRETVEGKLFLAGPLSDPEGLVMSGSGLIIYAAGSIAEARTLADGDPMHGEGQRSYTLQAWRLNEGAPVPGLRLSKRSFDCDLDTAGE